MPVGQDSIGVVVILERAGMNRVRLVIKLPVRDTPENGGVSGYLFGGMGLWYQLSGLRDP